VCSVGVGLLAWASASRAEPVVAPPPAAERTDAERGLVSPPERLSEAAVPYPEGGQGEARVVLELLIDAHGVVGEVSLAEGAEPFATAASSAARGWVFRPATRGGRPIPARIRVEVLFVPEVVAPVEPPQDAKPSPPPPAASPSATTQPSPAPAASGAALDEPVEILVDGERPVDVKSLGRGEVRQMPGAFGDPYRAIEALPGVTPIASGLPYFFVRGAPPGNVGYFFDEISVPLLYHVAAGPGVIHPAFVESVDLYSGGYPARYGRYAGGIVAGEAAAPQWRTRGEANIRLVDAGAFLELPFANQRGSAMLAGRYSYTGLVISLLAPEVTLGYWDYQGRVSYELSPKDTVTVFGFGSHDFLEAENEAGEAQSVLDLTFHRLNAGYRREIDDESALGLTLSLGLDRTGLGGTEDEEDGADLRNRTIGVRVAYERKLASNFRMRAGADAQLSRFDIDISAEQGDDGDEDEEASLPTLEEVTFPQPGFPELVLDPIEDLQFERNQDTIDSRFMSRDDVVSGVFIETVWTASPGVTVTPGLRFDMYRTGDTQSFAVEPRLGARFDITDHVSLIHAVGIAHQPPSFAIPIPGLTGSAGESLQRAVQTSAGIETKLPERITASATLFQNVIFDSTDLFGVSNLQTSDTDVSAFSSRTTNHSYGFELYIKRSLTERLGGFLAYTYTRSTRSVGRLEGPSSFERRHVVNVAAAYDLGRNWRLGGRVVTYSGIPGEVAYAAATLDPPRTPWYWRLDWRLEKRWPFGRDGQFWAVVLEALNTTLNKETLESSCYAYGCYEEPIGPVTIPSIGVEASF
jgi:hypothetical protein